LSDIVCDYFTNPSVVQLIFRLIIGELVHQRMKMNVSFENAFPVSSIAVFSVCDKNTPIYLWGGQKMMKYILRIQRR